MAFPKGKQAPPFGGKETDTEETAEMDDDAKAVKGRIDQRNKRSKRPGKQVKNPSGLAMQISKMKKGCK